MWKRLFLAIFILLSIEVGLFLLMFPWSKVWERNYLLIRVPVLRALFSNHYFRGALTGLGFVNIWVGLGEAWHFRDRIRDMESRPAAEAAGLKEVEPPVPADSPKV